MQNLVQSVVTVSGRFLIAAIFLMSAVGNKIPKFSDVAKYMASEGVPLPQLMLVGAILFLIVGSLSIIVGYKARIGAGLLFVFLVLATYFFHDFWNFDGQDQQVQMIQFRFSPFGVHSWFQFRKRVISRGSTGGRRCRVFQSGIARLEKQRSSSWRDTPNNAGMLRSDIV